MTLSVMGVLGVQAYWLYNRFQIEQASFEDSISGVLNRAFLDFVVPPSTEYFRKLGYPFIEDTVAHEAPISRNTAELTGADSAFIAAATGQANKDSTRTKGDINQLMDSDTSWQFMAKMMKGFFDAMIDPREENPKRLIGALDSLAHFSFDTLKLDIPFELAIFDKDDSLIISTHPYQTEVWMEEAIKLSPMGMFPGTHIRVYFPTQTWHLFREMWLALALSAFLIAITLGCLFYMLRLIFRQKKLSDIKTDFINNMTHELKTPIATVSTVVEAMQHFGVLQDAEKTEKYLAISKQQLQKLEQMVEKVLQIAAFDRGKIHLNKVETDLGKMLKDLAEPYHFSQKKTVTVRLIDDLNQPIISVDKSLLGHVLTNLLDNAIKYSGASPFIQVRAWDDIDNVYILVKDHGIGISPAHQKQVFEKFFRVPTGDLHPVKGFGLGLSYVKKIVDLHGGEISLKSTLGEGSEFTITIPRNINKVK